MKNKVKQSSIAILTLLLSSATGSMAHVDLERSTDLGASSHSLLQKHIVPHFKDADTVSNELLVEFGKEIAYAANKTDQAKYSAFETKMVGEGWTLKKILGTTGTAANQQTSVMAVMAFRGHEAIIATRGTEALNLNDWATNFRYCRNLLPKTISWIAPSLVDQKWVEQDDIKEACIAAQYMKAEDKIHNGFLQTHMSVWEEVKAELLKHDVKRIYTTGHSLGGAQQDLMQMHLLTDSTLGYGRELLAESLILGDSCLGFYLPKITVEKENTVVTGVAMEAPRAFGGKAAAQFDRIVGAENSPHIVNAGDIVPHVPFKSLGFEDATQNIIHVDSGDVGIKAHTNIKDVSIEALNGQVTEHEKTFTRKAVDGVASVPGMVYDAAESVVSTVGNAVNDYVVEPVISGVSTVVDGVSGMYHSADPVARAQNIVTEEAGRIYRDAERKLSNAGNAVVDAASNANKAFWGYLGY